jgi:DNA mismatch endonuclease (patch repair protein)
MLSTNPAIQKGKFVSEETKRKKSEIAKKLYIAGKILRSPPMLGKHFSEESKKKMREKRLKQVIPFKDTTIEKLIQGKLEELEVPFEKHKSILGQPDIFISPNICIFADGCYWHKCEKCGFGNGKERDKMVTENLQKQGFVVLRFWEHDIKSDLDSCMNKITEMIK